MNAYETILNEKLVAIVRGFAPETVVEMAKAYVANGIRCIEVTFDQASAEKRLETVATIKAIKAELGDQVCVGAGTVMTVEQVQMAAEAGAEYMISPNVDEDVIKETKRLGKISIPGAMTPSEIAAAYKMGADIIKLFPANEVGLSYIKAIKAPLKHIPLMATGGVRPVNAAEYLAAGSAALGVGGDLVNKAWIAAGEFDKIGAAAKAFVESIK
ncbi:MAG: bifunctional 4-hydroxy-2-oxoglutarate aldolase/2-dehydro-3-deoxy-phosphogluconate aldolase [Oscillospiraceae bacterium]|nr:bifunctional 4-hydroxy-2-oxoglutarate aldolase/2-dehydro-3-deoxy-phosphogluconate aldolase [Oscillospiraceae bacterium]